ncbi:hypothetical protein V8E55_004804 [Tylopilus felleus]
MPGTTLQVLPVGLCVYGGITAIGLFVVAFVTWERVKARKVCRGRKLDVRCRACSFDRVDLPPAKTGREQLVWVRDQRVSQSPFVGRSVVHARGGRAGTLAIRLWRGRCVMLFRSLGDLLYVV